MALKKRFQIFVSSTFADLRAERDAIANAIQAMGHIPAGMELFGSDAEDSWTVIERTIDLSDYFVLVLAGRYGSLSEVGVSFTEREFDHARSRNIPVLAFVHENTDELPAGVVEKTAKAQRHLKAFRTKVTADHQVSFWHSTPDLCTKVVASLARTIETVPRPGWVRGDIEIELKNLRMEKQSLFDRSRHLEYEIRNKNAIIDAFHRTPTNDDSQLATQSIPVSLKWTYKGSEHFYEATVDIPSLGAWLYAFQMRTLCAHTFALAVFLTALSNQSKSETYRRYPCTEANGIRLSSVDHYFRECATIPEATLAEIATIAMASGLLLADNPTVEAFKEYWLADPYGTLAPSVFAKLNDTCWMTCARHFSNLPTPMRPRLHPEVSKRWENWAANNCAN